MLRFRAYKRNEFPTDHMKETLKVINGMQAAGVIGRYAIGGAVGATFTLSRLRRRT